MVVEPKVAARQVPEHIVEIVSDAGEGAQTAGTLLAVVSAKMGNGVWTVEIIPAEIEPPARSTAGASGSRVRIGSGPVTNMGDCADVVVAFNEQVLFGRIDQGAMREGTILFIDSKWAEHRVADIRTAYSYALKRFRGLGYLVHEVPMEVETLRHTDNPRRGRNTWVLGMLCAFLDRDVTIALDEVRKIFEKRGKGEKVVLFNHALILAGYEWGLTHLDHRVSVPGTPADDPMVAMNGNAAIALGAMAAGIEMCSMYPITPATSVSHYLAGMFHDGGGFVHQAEDEIAAVGFAIGASYAGKTAMTVTSGPGMALKSEMLGLAVMAEIPLVVVDVQRGGPSTGLPTKVEQGDLLAALYGHPGDAPKIILAPATIDECFQYMVAARKLAETFRTPVIVLTDANLATGTTNFAYPEPQEDWLSPPVDQSPWREGVRPYEWDATTGLSQRPIPGQLGGAYTLTGLAHNERSKVAYESAMNQHAMTMRSNKLHTLRESLQPPEVRGATSGDLLVVGWGSTKGAIEEACDRLVADGHQVSSLHLRFLSPLEPGLVEIFARFNRVMTIEINYSDEYRGPSAAVRAAQLATILRSETLVDVQSWSRVPGQPLPPAMIEDALRVRLATPAAA